MQERNRIRLIVDIVLTILFIALLYAENTGFTFHEIAGLAMGALLIYHIVLNWSWIKSIGKNLFNPRLKAKPKLFYLLNTVSLLAVALIIVTGVQISMVLFPADEMISHTLIDVHKWVSYACVGLFGLHIALHWQFIAKNIPRLFRASDRSAWGRAALSTAAVMLILSLLYTQIAVVSKDVSSDNRASESNDMIARQSVQKQDEIYTDRPRRGHGHGRIAQQEYAYYDQKSSPGSTSNADEIAVPGSGDSLHQQDQNNETSTDSNIASDNGNDKPSLNEYLGSLFCDACEKHCSLLSLRCDRGIPQLEAAQQQYQSIYVQ